MGMTIGWALLALCCLLPLGAQAGQNLDPIFQKDSVCGNRRVITINGVATNADDARRNMASLQLLYGNSLDEYRVLFFSAYNPTGGLAADIQQSYAQIVASYPGVTFQEWLTAVWTGIFPDSWSAAVTAAIAGRIGNLIGLQRPDAQQDSDMQAIIADITRPGAYIPPADRLLMVPHSQGNIYAVKIWDRFTTQPLLPVWPDRFTKPPLPPQTVGMVGVAAVVPAIRNGVHVTSNWDAVVGGVRTVFPVLPNNIPLSFAPFDDILGHNFRNIYLKFADARIIANIDETMRNLRAAGPPLSIGSSTGSKVQGYTQECGYGPEPMAPAPCPFYNSQTGGTVVYNEPVIVYPVAGQGGVVQAGTPADLDVKLVINLRECNALWVERRKTLGASVYLSTAIPGCTDGAGTLSWVNYSADSTAVSFVNSASIGRQQYRTARMKPMCQPS